MSTWLAFLIAAAAITATYFFCIRPMRRGQCGMAMGDDQRDEKRTREIADLREELRILRAEDSLGSGPARKQGETPAPSDDPRPRLTKE